MWPFLKEIARLVKEFVFLEPNQEFYPHLFIRDHVKMDLSKQMPELVKIHIGDSMVNQRMPYLNM